MTPIEIILGTVLLCIAASAILQRLFGDNQPDYVAPPVTFRMQDSHYNKLANDACVCTLCGHTPRKFNYSPEIECNWSYYCPTRGCRNYIVGTLLWEDWERLNSRQKQERLRVDFLIAGMDQYREPAQAEES